MRTTNSPLFTDFDMIADGYSKVFDLELVSGYSLSAQWIGNPTGFIFLQISNDFNQPTNWELIDLSIHPTGGISNSATYKQSLAAYRWIRLGYAYGSGSGTLNARLSCKGLT